MTDLEIAQATQPNKIVEVAKKLGLNEDDLDLYGKYKAKIDIKYSKNPNGKLVLVTAINPTPAGEGKSTTTIGLADAFALLNKKVCVALREQALDQFLALKVEHVAEDIHRLFLWKISIFTLQVISMQ